MNFLEQEPGSGDAHLQLANVHQAMGDLEAAEESLEDAAILSDSSLESEIELARLQARRGDFKAADGRLNKQLVDDLTPQQRVQVLGARAEVALVTGLIENAIALHVEINEIATAFMPPLLRLMRIENQQANLLSLLGRAEEALAIADEVAAQLQPPVDVYMNFTYAAIYEAANDRPAYREWVNRTLQVQDQLPPIFQPIIEMEMARLAIWDEEFDEAITHLDRASELLGQSLITVMQNNLSTSSLQVTLADLYLQADAIEDAVPWLEENMKVGIQYVGDDPSGLELPKLVEVTVVETDPPMKGATASASPKPARLANGVMLKVPQFVESGELIRVDPVEGRYVERAR